MGIQSCVPSLAQDVQACRIPTQDFDRDVTAVAMDDRFILVGQVDGKLSAVYHKNGVSVFSAKISDSEITAVCCEEQDETDNPISYAGDVEGNLYTVNKKGKVLKTAKLQARKGKIFTISNRNKYQLLPRHHRLQEGELLDGQCQLFL